MHQENNEVTTGSVSGVKKYAVHLTTQVRVRVAAVQAASMEMAIRQAENQINFHELLDVKQTYNIGGGMTVDQVEWAESESDFFLVDTLLENGEVDYDNTCWFGPDLVPLINGKTTLEQKADQAAMSAKFAQELLDSVESLTGIAEEHGARTLADLMYLQMSILDGGFIDYYPEESHVLSIVQSLPSGDEWVKFIKTAYMEQPIS